VRLLKKKKILVIDDSATIRSHLSHLLGKAGYEVLEEPDGMLGAFAIRERCDLSLVICDVNMPRMDGLQMLDVLHGQFGSLPIIMLTTESRLDKLDRAKRAGAKAWIIKPFKPELLVAAVTKLIGA
jgi:two-component system chemotaxis response regulator CheY